MLYTCITGATSGIGKASADLFASKGHNLILLGRRKDRLVNLQHIYQTQYGIQVIIGAIDIRDHTQIESFFVQLDSTVSIEYLINSAGVARGFDILQNAHIEDIKNIIETNITGLLIFTKFALSYMKGSGKHIFNLGSISGHNPYIGGVAYSTSKAGVIMASKCLSMELEKDHILVTCISPGLVDTEFQIMRAGGDQDQVDRFLKTRIGTGQQLKAEDIAQIIYDIRGKDIPEIIYRHKKL